MKEGEEEVKQVLQSEEIQLYDFTKKINLKEESLEDLKAVLVLPSGEHEVQLIRVEVEPPNDFLIQARVTLINKLFFDAI